MKTTVPAQYPREACKNGEAELSEIRLGADKIERIISQVLRDDGKLPPAKANDLATIICLRLSTSMPLPNNQQLRGYRMIAHFGPRKRPSDGVDFDDFANDLQKKIGGDVDDATARAVWELVWNYSDELPPGVAEGVR